MGRFLAKIGLEALANSVKGVPGWNDELVSLPELEPIRAYARFGVGSTWPFLVRTLHPVNAVFTEGDVPYEVLHEFKLLHTARSETFAVVSLFGVEFVMNLGGRELDGFMEWLEQNEFASALYPPSEATTATAVT